MEQETFNNRLASPLNFQAMNVSGKIPLESISLNPSDLPASSPEEAQNTVLLPAALEENISSPVTELQEMPIAQIDEPPVQEAGIKADSNRPEEDWGGLNLFSMHEEADRARMEAEAPALWMWDGERHGASATVTSPNVETMAAESLVAPEIIEELSYAAVNQITEILHNLEAPKEPMVEQHVMPAILAVAPPEEKTVAPTLLSFHGLKQQPFDVTPDPSYLYFSPSHREALTSLSEGVENFRGFMALIAEPGMGKTTLLNKLMEEVSATARVVFLFQTQCSSQELLAFFLNELEVDHTGMDIVAMHRALNQVLLEEMLRGRRFVLIVDEAQNLQDSVLETIRLLSDFETAHSKLIQIVLAGQPQLVDTLMRPNLVQLRQRIAILSTLSALNAAETAEYIGHRLRAAGWNGQQLFTPEAMEAIAELSDGLPRTINNLCFNSLLKAFTRRQSTIDAAIVKEVAGKLNLEALARRTENVATQSVAAQQQYPATVSFEDRAAEEILRALSAAFPSAEARSIPVTESVEQTQEKPGVVVDGKLNDKIRCQSWSKNHEFRIEVSFDRGTIPGVSVADRHYCCNFYIAEEDAAALQVGKPIRIRIEQE